MCISPILIKNPNYKHTVDNSHDVHVHMKDTTSQYIEMRCGHCPECLILKQTYIRQRSVLMARTHDIFFCTLTYNQEMLPTMEVNGIKHAYADIRDFQNLVKRLRKMDFFGAPFKYICCTEYGGKKHRPHFHVLFFVQKPEHKEDEYDVWNKTQCWYWGILHLWRRNVNTDVVVSRKTGIKHVRVNTRKPVWKPICTYVRDRKGRCTYDFHQVVPRRTKNGVADVCTYVTKYCLKFDKWVQSKQQALRLNLDDDEYKRVWNLVKPRLLISKHFGDDDIFDEVVRKGIDYSIRKGEKYFVFIDPNTGHVSPLAPYLRDKFATYIDKLELWMTQPHDPDNVRPLSDAYEGLNYANKETKYKRIYATIITRNSDEFYELE